MRTILQPDPVEAPIVRLNREYPSWGAPKIREKLRQQFTGPHLPAISTVHAVLDEHGLVKRRRRRRHAAAGTALSRPTETNALWCADYGTVEGIEILTVRQFLDRLSAAGPDAPRDPVVITTRGAAAFTSRPTLRPAILRERCHGWLPSAQMAARWKTEGTPLPSALRGLDPRRALPMSGHLSERRGHAALVRTHRDPQHHREQRLDRAGSTGGDFLDAR